LLFEAARYAFHVEVVDFQIQSNSKTFLECWVQPITIQFQTVVGIDNDREGQWSGNQLPLVAWQNSKKNLSAKKKQALTIIEVDMIFRPISFIAFKSIDAV
jgi:hypothetical protein